MHPASGKDNAGGDQQEGWGAATAAEIIRYNAAEIIRYNAAVVNPSLAAMAAVGSTQR